MVGRSALAWQRAFPGGSGVTWPGPWPCYYATLGSAKRVVWSWSCYACGPDASGRHWRRRLALGGAELIRINVLCDFRSRLRHRIKLERLTATGGQTDDHSG